ncbi:MAG: fluoride efflux transporter FluC [Phycisphaerae bacterium]
MKREKPSLLAVIAVGAGGAAGALCRHAIHLAMPASAFPWGTLLINVGGCFALGVFFGRLQRPPKIPNAVRLGIGTGLIGGFAAFSDFALGADQFWQTGRWVAEVAYLIANIGLGLLAIRFGWVLTGAPRRAVVE